MIKELTKLPTSGILNSRPQPEELGENYIKHSLLDPSSAYYTNQYNARKEHEKEGDLAYWIAQEFEGLDSKSFIKKYTDYPDNTFPSESYIRSILLSYLIDSKHITIRTEYGYKQALENIKKQSFPSTAFNPLLKKIPMEFHSIMQNSIQLLLELMQQQDWEIIE